MNEPNPKIELDILRHVEKLTEQVNKNMAPRGRSVLRRYPLTFALLVLFGAVAVAEGAKGIIEDLGIFDGHPVYMLVTGLVILIVTGTLYKKLDK